MKITSAALFLLMAVGSPVGAQETMSEQEKSAAKPTVAFVEVAGAYGFQFGQQDYLPTGAGVTSKHPLTNGYAIGASAGWEFLPGLVLTGNWEYAKSNSRNGSVTNALDSVEGRIDYHTIAAGLRWTRLLGPGRLFGELGAGIALPFETTVAYDYASAMSQVGVSGSGTMIDKYNLGFGAYGQAGYQWDITKGLYLGAGLKLKSFQSNNDGQQRQLNNFVADFTHPSPVTMTIDYSTDGPNKPKTYSVQDLRFQLALGFRI